MAFVWLTSSFNNYLLSFGMKNFPGSIYVNSAISACSEIASIFFSGAVYKLLGIRACLVLFFGISALGGLSIILYHFCTNSFGD